MINTVNDTNLSTSISNNTPVSRKNPIQREIARTLNDKKKRKEEVEGTIELHANKHKRLNKLLEWLQDIIKNENLVFTDIPRWESELSPVKDSIWKTHGKLDMNDTKKLKEQIEALEKKQRGLAIILSKVYSFVKKDIIRRNDVYDEMEGMKMLVSNFMEETLQEVNTFFMCAGLQGNNSVTTTTTTSVIQPPQSQSNGGIIVTTTTKGNGGQMASHPPRHIVTNLFALNRDPSTNPGASFQFRKKRRNNKNSSSSSDNSNNRATIASLEDVKMSNTKRRTASSSSNSSSPSSSLSINGFAPGGLIDGNSNNNNGMDVDEASAVISKRGRKRKANKVSNKDMESYEQAILRSSSSSNINTTSTTNTDAITDNVAI